MDLSIIIPHYHEHPQLLFTLQSIINELDTIDYEIILVDNAPTPQHDHPELDSVKYIQRKMIANALVRVKQYKYSDGLSHWQAKNLGVKNSSGKLLLFLDAHVIIKPGSIVHMLEHYGKLPDNSLLHLPIVYLLEDNRLIYQLIHNLALGVVDYRFSPLISSQGVIEVPCMSTCGMLISRDTLINTYDCWPSVLGSYSGGEQFINFVGALLGVRKFVFTEGAVYHYAAPRSYTLDNGDIHRNKAISLFLFGGSSLFHRYLDGLCRLERGRVSPRVINKFRVEIPAMPELQERRHYIKHNSKNNIEDWINEWSNFYEREYTA